MKLPKIFHHKHTIAGRMTWRVLSTMTIIMALFLALVCAILWFLFYALLLMSTKESMNVYDERVNNVFSIVEVAVSNNVPEVEENINREHREYFAVEHLLALNPIIMGAAVAYNPDYEPKKGEPFSVYCSVLI